MGIDSPDLDQWHRDVPKSARGPIVLGVSILSVLVCVFIVWASVAPIASAVMTSGYFVATGQNKQVQHLEGGIIREMLVKEGDLVQADQSVARLDDTAARSRLRRLALRKCRLIVVSARLNAEITSAESMKIPDLSGNGLDTDTVQAIVQAQLQEFAARRTNERSSAQVLRAEIAALQESIGGYQAQANSSQTRISLVEEELKSKNELMEKSLVRRSEVLGLMRSSAGLTGELGELLGRIGDSKERIARAEQQIVQLRTTAIQKASDELQTATADLDDVNEQIRAAQDVLARTEIRAPVRGIVVKLYQHTAGGVVAAGGSILDLLPVNDELVVQGRVRPADVTYIKEGQRALVRLTSLKQRLTPMVEGTVTYLSADIVPDTAASAGPGTPQGDSPTGASFVVRVRVDQSDLTRKIENVRPTPGMPAELFIETGSRTFFDYLLRPLQDTLVRAFREK